MHSTTILTHESEIADLEVICFRERLSKLGLDASVEDIKYDFFKALQELPKVGKISIEFRAEGGRDGYSAIVYDIRRKDSKAFKGQAFGKDPMQASVKALNSIPLNNGIFLRKK
ncbi:hypothetical protein [Vibrio phage vB_VmeM-Yong XC32]|nr:hypothetical protein [Vibrio phage vB_VmeM-Yong XC31]QAX96504.1 hypothetical protein [Vibrio phage vB_VmeM-Yong XC32]QAX96821.1 hypothetical protein [Vibrio phage vB_VmeM-Yong MS31]QAX97140.1 hypothetical protein [Vibrio phage vB_VmeM-Yong MS32]